MPEPAGQRLRVAGIDWLARGAARCGAEATWSARVTAPCTRTPVRSRSGLLPKGSVHWSMRVFSCQCAARAISSGLGAAGPAVPVSARSHCVQLAGGYGIDVAECGDQVLRSPVRGAEPAAERPVTLQRLVMGGHAEHDPVPLIAGQMGQGMGGEPEGVDLMPFPPGPRGTGIADHLLEPVRDLPRVVQQAGEDHPLPEPVRHGGDASHPPPQQAGRVPRREQVLGQQLPARVSGVHAAFRPHVSQCPHRRRPSSRRLGWAGGRRATACPASVT